MSDINASINAWWKYYLISNTVLVIAGLHGLVWAEYRLILSKRAVI
jgi:hypothetical protein